jgi:DNA gyrase subunit B
MFGKILNTERARLDKVLEFEAIKTLIIALGCGIGDTVDYEKLRYHRVILMSDADVDGSHIRTLMLTFLFRYLPEVLTRGYVYIAQPPLFRIQKGKEVLFAYNDAEKDQIMKQMGGNQIVEIAETETAEPEEYSENSEAKPAKRAPAINIQRYKGLGEMNAEQLWDTTMNPEVRILKHVTMDDAVAADEVFTMLMGPEVPPRKRFIQTHAKQAILDV